MSENPAVRVRLSVLHAAFDEKRRAGFSRLYETLLQECKGLEDRIDLHVYHEVTPRGSLAPWLDILRDGVAKSGEEVHGARVVQRFAPTHLVFLPDDVTLCEGFGKALLRAIEARPGDVLCALSNHPEAFAMAAAGARWYTTPDGFAAFAGCLPVAFAREHLAWRMRHLTADCLHESEGGDPQPDVRLVQGDEGVNLHLMAIGKPCFKMLPSLVQHDEPESSLDGSNVDPRLGWGRRRSTAFPAQGDLSRVPYEETEKTYDAGRTYKGNHWGLIFDVDLAGERHSVAEERIERAYRLERQSGHLDAPEIDVEPHVFISVPEYQPALPAQRVSLEANVRFLRSRGVKVTVDYVTGQSLVTRARNWGCVHRFMASTANILFQWDGDVECRDEEALHKMLALGYPVLAGAYPLRDGSGGVVAQLPRKPGGSTLERELRVEEDGTCLAAEVATGFLMVTRKTLVHLMARHPELLHEQDGGPNAGAPAWALFDTRLVAWEGHRGRRRRYLSEDWEFSRLCREAGIDVRLYLPPILRHWGLTPCDGHALVAFGAATKEEVYGAGGA